MRSFELSTFEQSTDRPDVSVHGLSASTPRSTGLDPGFTMDGFTYERAAITEWLRDGDTSPFTGATLERV